MPKKVPTPDHPCRSVAPLSGSQGSVSGHYQVVVNMPSHPTKQDELLAFADAAESLAELARKWAADDSGSGAQGPEKAMRITVAIHMRPEGDGQS